MGIKSNFFAYENPFLGAFIVGLLNMCSVGHTQDRRGVATQAMIAEGLEVLGA